MDDEQLGRKIVWGNSSINNERQVSWDYASVGARARALFAKPEAKREEVKEWWDNKYDDDLSRASLEKLCAALSHFAPPARPKMMIQGMSVEDIAAEFRNSWHSPDRPATDQWYSQHVARVAHRLANTPAPEHDPDAEAKRVHEYLRSAAPDQIVEKWEEAAFWWKDVCRAVAAAKREAGGE